MTDPTYYPLGRRFCPVCGHDIAPSGETSRVRCPACAEELSLSELRLAPALPGHLLPLIVAWALSPALLAVAAGILSIVSSEKIGTGVFFAALLGAPVLLYTWSAFIVRRVRDPLWWLAAIPLAFGMAVVNWIVAAMGCALINV